MSDKNHSVIKSIIYSEKSHLCITPNQSLARQFSRPTFSRSLDRLCAQKTSYPTYHLSPSAVIWVGGREGR